MAEKYWSVALSIATPTMASHLIFRESILADRPGRRRLLHRAFRASNTKHSRRRRSTISAHDRTTDSSALITSL
jgi:hypothetical protein